MSCPPVITVRLPQRPVVSRRKIQMLAQYLRACRYGGREAIPWQRLSTADQQWWFQEALRHLVVAELVAEQEQEVPLGEPIGVTTGVLPAAAGAVRELCQS